MATKVYELKIKFTADLNKKTAKQVVEEMVANSAEFAADIENEEEGITNVTASFIEL